MSTNVYRAPNAPGFGDYVPPPRRPAPVRGRPAVQRARYTLARGEARTAPLRRQARPRREAHPAWGIVLRELQRRLRRLTWILRPPRAGERPAHAAERARLLERHGRESYAVESEHAQRHARICRQAMREGWTRVPEGVDRALRAFEHARTLPAKWSALDDLKAKLFLRREKEPNGPCTHPT